ncbi:hypothetical protein PEX2_074680 [Penicillium expansum]|uniref:Uncharacterized protein n=1 Tax=Penicillium expansum TaxID=27334 RepID=A0A0A2JXW0_PENEN|nr:hypothetical protein PEX2_074680 [Penicillium expansum]KGO38608.1 hypothetical protein PEXP_083010 [Penicillium expansum]KGO59488.1 hypothetical protein PEX2_074680 [Penicillium expansum]
MDPIDPNEPPSGLDQPAFDSQAFFNGLANLDAEGPFNGSNDFNYEVPELLGSFDEYYASIDLDALDQSGFDQPRLTTPINPSVRAVSNNLPAHAPYSQMTYDPLIGIAYTPVDTEADKIRKWENLIAHANLASAGVPPSAPQSIEEELVEQNPPAVDSPNSLFESPRSPSVDALGTPSTTPSTPSPPQPPAATMASSNPAKNLTASTIPRTVHLPRALTSHKGYAQHVSPFAPVATISPPVHSAPNSRELENARSRIQILSRERNYYQRCLRKATAIDPKTGKTSLQLLQAENAALRRVNAKQVKENESLKREIEGTRKSYASLVDNYNSNIKQLHRAQFELRQLGK